MASRKTKRPKQYLYAHSQHHEEVLVPRTVFATNLISDLSRLFEFDVFRRLSSRYLSTRDGGSWISSINWRMHGRPWKRSRASRSLSKRYFGALLTITVSISVLLQHVKERKELENEVDLLHSSPDVFMEFPRNAIRSKLALETLPDFQHRTYLK
jgi:hypothetical protein